MIVLKKNHVLTSRGLVVIELKDCFQVLLFEIFLLEFENDLVSLFDLAESLAEYSQISLNFFCRLGINFTGNTFDVVDFTLTESLEELSVVRH